jgi:hypothetical protein
MGAYSETHETWTPDKINMFFLQKAKEHNVNRITIESNSGGQAVMLFFKAHHLPVILQNFGGDGEVNARAAYIKIARELLDERACLLKSSILRNELLIYDPGVAAKEKNKGDLADAFLHFTWIAMDGVNYFKRKMLEQRKKEQIVYAK